MNMRRNSEPIPAELGHELASLFSMHHQQIEEPSVDDPCMISRGNAKSSNKRTRHSAGFTMPMSVSLSQLPHHHPELEPKKRKIQRITSTLPQRMSSLSKKKASKRDTSAPNSRADGGGNEQSSAASHSPHQALLDAFSEQSKMATVRPTLSIDGFFIEHTEEQIKAYDMQVIEAIRSQDIEQLRQMHKSGRQLQCANKFGESLVHMACRRGFVDVVRFLVDEAGVSVRVRDDYGRTVLHDACWTSEPNEELVEYLIRQCPELLLMSDKRGNAPFEYARREHWGRWVTFVQENIYI